MIETNKRSIEKILEDLSYAFASPEAEEFMRSIREKNYRKAKNMLLKKIEPAEATIIINHFKKEVKNKFVLTEITHEEFNTKYPYNTQEIKQKVVVNYRGEILSSYLEESYYNKNTWCIHVRCEEIEISSVDQIWIVEKK